MKKTLFITLILLSFKLIGQDVPPPPPPPSSEDIIEFEIPELDENYDSMVDAVYDFPEENPEFKGGAQKMYEYLRDNIQYPEMAKENAIQGRVFVQFIVGKDGVIREIKVLKGVHETLDKEAIRVVKSMPKWNPGKSLGVPVNVRFTLPINFKIN